VEDLDREVLALLAEDLLLLLLEDLAGPVMRIDDVVPDLVLDLGDLYLEVCDLLLRNGLANDVPPGCRWRGAAPVAYVCR
jgi:hypothetical protein